jgi:pimeloyl-ACP methyl ester carboxylesterase
MIGRGNSLMDRSRWGVCAAAVAVALCTGASGSEIAWSEFPLPLDDEHRGEVRFGTLDVPMDSSRPERGDAVRLAFMVLPARGRQPADDAVLFLPGGPGQPWSPYVPGFLGSDMVERLRQRRDVVLVDPRGTGLSEPKLCDPLDAIELIYPTIFGEPFEVAERRARESFRECGDSLAARGIDPEVWGAAEVADDVERLRRALGYERWTVRGHSYGSRFAQELLRRYPETVRAAILSGVWPAGPYSEERIFDVTVAALRTVFDACAADAACRAAYPGLRARFIELIHRLEREPLRLAIDGLPRPVVVDGPTLVAVIYQLQYQRDSIATIPLLVDSLAAGNRAPLRLLIGGLLDLYTATRHDLRHVVQCNDDRYSDDFDPARPFADPFAAALRGIWYPRARMYWGIDLHCEELGIAPPASRPVRSDVPVMLFNGRHDALTPPALAGRITPYLSNHVEFTVPGRGHDPSVEVGNVIAAFVEQPERRPELSGLDDIAPLPFLADVRSAPGLARLTAGLAGGSTPMAVLLWPAAAALLLAVGFVGIPVRALRMRRAGSPADASLVPRLAWAAAACGLAFFVLVGVAVIDAAQVNPYLPVFGVAERWQAVFTLPWMMLAAAAYAAWLAVRRRRRVSWLEGTTAAGAVTLAAFLLDRGIL